MTEDDDRCDRCADTPTVGYADEVCCVCEHVPLCQRCLDVHRTEAVEDGTPIC